ncbi:DUF192 domain-containing protein [Trichococcus pasteurii]|uniref:DUF192 domain-containing protein n=1 Tax=Trichococcus pasteurii TaxID=43064 RepID=A0A1W1IF82_9LACT|nr:DUF192 domain-containing protein [Trichococcus pasteurii]SFE45791.1 hypothetical protein SAMN04488086_10461 [Trichococcus pasteurii]SLM51680.1 Hypothetical protein TPAS_1357 [Trichococcus pasteurii]SSB92561.1 Hypothetical protein TPAS_1357 [Trichococcus pasteurii]
MKRLINAITGEVILEDLQTADTFYDRFRGLMGRPSIPENTGLMIKPCNSVHCFFMKFPIDVIFLDKEDRVVHIAGNMKPGTISPIVKRAKYVVEANAMKFTGDVMIGDKLEIV